MHAVLYLWEQTRPTLGLIDQQIKSENSAHQKCVDEEYWGRVCCFSPWADSTERRLDAVEGASPSLICLLSQASLQPRASTQERACEHTCYPWEDGLWGSETPRSREWGSGISSGGKKWRGNREGFPAHQAFTKTNPNFLSCICST